MDRPDLRTMTRRQAAEYIIYLEGLLDPSRIKPGARRSDPATSKRAATTAFPRVKSHRFRILEVLDRHRDGLIADEVVALTGIAGAWKRLSDLTKGGWAYTDGERKATSGDDAGIYFISELGITALARHREGVPPVPPTKKDGSLAAPPSDLMPDNLFDQQEA